MKKLFLFVVFIVVTSSPFAQKKNMVTIKGVVNGDLKGHNKMFIFTRTSKDSTIMKNGHYSFTFPFKEASLKMIYPEYVREMKMIYRPFGILIAEPGVYYINSDISKGMAESSEIKGPSGATIYRDFEAKQDEAFGKITKTMVGLYGLKWYMTEEKDSNFSSQQKSRDSLTNIHMYSVIEDIVKKNPSSPASAFILSGAGRQLPSLELKEELLGLLSPKMKQSAEGKKFADYLQGLKSSNIGNIIADFILPDPQGESIDIKSFRGKYVLLDFWASWCGPCRKSFPHMREVYKKYSSNNFDILSISTDESQEDWLKAVKEEQNPWPQVLDTKNIAQRGFAITGIPTTYLIDPQGKILMKEVGFDPNGGSEIEKKIKEIADNNGKEKPKMIPATKMF